MAIIKCPRCGHEISDRAAKCIYCGTVLAEEEIRCIDCGKILLETDEICPNCGGPVEKKSTRNVKSQLPEVTSIKMRKKRKKIMIGIIIAVLICVIGSIRYKIYLTNKELQKYLEVYNGYISDLDNARFFMLASVEKTEPFCDLILNLWSNLIYQKTEDETDKYIRPDGYFVSDFKIAVSNLFADPETTEMLADIEQMQSDAKDLVEKLQDPAGEFNNCYDAVSDLYKAYKTLTDLVINPFESYTEFSKNKSDAILDFKSAFESLDNQIPGKIEIE